MGGSIDVYICIHIYIYMMYSYSHICVYGYIPGSSNCVNFVPFQQQKPTKRQKSDIFYWVEDPGIYKSHLYTLRCENPPRSSTKITSEPASWEWLVLFDWDVSMHQDF